MKRIHRFSDFSAIYEQTTVPPTDQSRVYDGTLNQILTSILNTYISTVLYPVQDYSPKIPEDIKFVELAPVERKVERFKEITERVRKAAEDNKDSKAQEVLKAWIEANSKSIEALEAIISRYQDTPADLDYMGKVINARLNEYLKELEEQAKRAQKNESVFLDLGGEGFLFEGKKRTMDDIETQVSIVNAKLASLALSLDKIPGAAAKVTALQNEVTRISQRIGELRGKKRRDIDKEELERIETRLAEIPTEMESITKDAAKQDTVNKDIAAILIEALELTAKADKLEQEYKKAKQEVQAQAQAQARTQAVKISKTIYYNSSKIGEKNEDVQKVQKVIMDRFGPVKKISDLPQYKEFSRFGADGKFGPRTQKMIKILQKGLGYDELTGNITPKFLERIQTEKILESYSSPRTIYRFSDFKGLFEDFDVNAAVEYASSQAEDPVPSSAGSTPYVANTNNPSGSSTITPPPGDLKVQPQVAAEALGVDSYDKFKSLSRDKKWQWLLEAFKEGANYKVRKSEVGVQQDTSSTIFTIFWKKEELSSDGNEIATVCWYPTNDKVPGKYVDYTPDSPKAGAWGKIEDGDWGYKIDGNSNFKVTWNLKTNLKKNNEALDWIVKNKGAVLEKDYDATVDSLVDHGDKRLLRVHLFPTSSRGSKSLTGLFKGGLSERGYYPASSDKKSATLAFFSDGTVDIIYTVKLPSYGGFGSGTPTKVVTRAKWKKTTTGNLNISWYDKAAEKQKDITI